MSSQGISRYGSATIHNGRDHHASIVTANNRHQQNQDDAPERHDNITYWDKFLWGTFVMITVAFIRYNFRKGLNASNLNYKAALTYAYGFMLQISADGFRAPRAKRIFRMMNILAGGFLTHSAGMITLSFDIIGGYAAEHVSGGLDKNFMWFLAGWIVVTRVYFGLISPPTLVMVAQIALIEGAMFALLIATYTVTTHPNLADNFQTLGGVLGLWATASNGYYVYKIIEAQNEVPLAVNHGTGAAR